MSYERKQQIGLLGAQMGMVARHIAQARGASRRAAELARSINPELGSEVEGFFCDNIGLCRSAAAIGNYIGQVMWREYAEEMSDAENQAYSLDVGASARPSVALGSSSTWRRI